MRKHFPKGKKMDGLTPKQEAFAVAFFETGNAAEAYRRSYDVAPDAKDEWIYVEACQLLDHPKITLRLKALQEQAERHSIYTRQKAMDELEAARQMAMEERNAAGAVAAVKGKVGLYGLDRPNKLEVTGKDGGPIEVAPDEAFKRLASRLGGAASTPEGSA